MNHAPITYGWTSYHRISRTSAGRSSYIGRFQGGIEHGRGRVWITGPTVTMQFRARHPFAALRRICRALSHGADPRRLLDRTIN